jgi:hypothetical protein
MAAAGIAAHLATRFSSGNLRHWADVPLYLTLRMEMREQSWLLIFLCTTFNRASVP